MRKFTVLFSAALLTAGFCVAQNTASGSGTLPIQYGRIFFESSAFSCVASAWAANSSAAVLCGFSIERISVFTNIVKIIDYMVMQVDLRRKCLKYVKIVS